MIKIPIRTFSHNIFILLFAVISSLITAQASQGKAARTALVIGNADYKTAPLRNPVNDANDMADTLRLHGFSVIYAENANRSTMRKAVREFEETLSRVRGTGLFYYAGHGVQLHGKNYLVPIGANIEREYEVPDETILAELVIQAMAYAGNNLNIVILDACRNNPYPKSFRSASRGLARMETMGSGMLIAYATSPGSTAFDGDGDNGIYTKYLLKAINTPGMSLEQIFKTVRQNVIEETSKAQTPWEESSLTGDFYFIANDNAAVIVNRSGSSDQMPDHAVKLKELTFWKGISASETRSDYEIYLNTYPDGVFTELARSRIAALQSNEKSSSSGSNIESRSTPTTTKNDLAQQIIGTWKFSYMDHNKTNYLQFTFNNGGKGNAEEEEAEGDWWAEPISWSVENSHITIQNSENAIESYRIEHIDRDSLLLLGMKGSNSGEFLKFAKVQQEQKTDQLPDHPKEFVGNWKETWEDDGETAYQIYTFNSDTTATQKGWQPGENWSEQGNWIVKDGNILLLSGDGFKQEFKIINVTKEYLDMVDLSPGYYGQGSRFRKIEEE